MEAQGLPQRGHGSVGGWWVVGGRLVMVSEGGLGLIGNWCVVGVCVWLVKLGWL